MLHRARSLVAWSQWAASSLVDDYNIDPSIISVIPPGVDTRRWRRELPRNKKDGPIRILFVGGDFERKGGDVLVEAFQRLLLDPEVAERGVELDLVTMSDVPEAPGITVHRGLTPNCAELIALYHRSDIFCLPTRADCSPLVLAEAAAAGLPAITTSIGGVAESVIDGTTGHLVDPTVDGVAGPLRQLILDDEHRLAMSDKAARHATQAMDAGRNSQRILDKVTDLAQAKERSVVLTVSGRLEKGLHREIATGARPLADYVAIARSTDASLLGWNTMASETSITNRVIQRFGGKSIALAQHIFARRHQLDAVVTDGEQIGLPLAFLLRMAGGSDMRHVMIGHRLSPHKKAIPTRLLGLAPFVDEILVYSTAQYEVAKRLFPNQRVRLTDFMVDAEFFQPTRSLDEPRGDRRPMLCAAGREFRDYPTLIGGRPGPGRRPGHRQRQPVVEAGPTTPTRSKLPPNVTVTSFTQAELRDQLDRSDMLVMPLQACDFQAGITTILEAMSMERPVICTLTDGQTDVVVDGENGLVVPPADPAAFRAAIQRLIDQPELATAMGKRGRELILERADVRIYADLFGSIVTDLIDEQAESDDIEDDTVRTAHWTGQLASARTAVEPISGRVAHR